jgi:hypothetical protein
VEVEMEVEVEVEDRGCADKPTHTHLTKQRSRRNLENLEVGS